MAKAKYEGMFLFPAGQVEPEAAIAQVRGIVERHHGTVLVIKKWDERKLAYEIKRYKRGLYILCYFTAPGAAISAITRDVQLSDDLLRVLITDASHLNETEMAAVEPQQPAPPTPSFGDRPPRRRDDFPAEVANA